MSVSIVDCGVGNLGSIRNMLKKNGAESQIAASAEQVERATRLILPGVGSFDTAMTRIREAGLEDALRQRVLTDRVPILGICLGMQLLAESSEEGDLPGLGWLPLEIRRFSVSEQSNLKIPHMGWNTLSIKRETPLLQGLKEAARFYFIHSYHAPVEPDACCVYATTEHGYEFASVIGRDNIWGAQFHPERSHRFGMRLLKNFVELC